MEIQHIIKDGVDYYRLYVSCPTCMEKGLLDNTNDSRKYWHCECGGNIYIGSNAHILCPQCGQEFTILNSRFSCTLCSSENLQNVVRFDESKITTNLPLVVGGEMSMMRSGGRWLRQFGLSLDKILD